MKVNALVDDDAPVVAEIMGTERKMDYSEMHVGGKAFKICTTKFESVQHSTPPRPSEVSVRKIGAQRQSHF